MFEKIKEYLEELKDVDILQIWNEYCNEENYMDDIILDNDLNELLHGCTPEEVAQRVYYGDYRFNDPYAIFNGYGNIDTTDDATDWISYNELAQYIVDTEYDFGDLEIREILDKGDIN